jgi:hypothetical protein
MCAGVTVWLGSVADLVSGVVSPVLAFDSPVRDKAQQIRNFKGDYNERPLHQTVVFVISEMLF